jgi:hypothetical protein
MSYFRIVEDFIVSHDKKIVCRGVRPEYADVLVNSQDMYEVLYRVTRVLSEGPLSETDREYCLNLLNSLALKIS